MNRTRLLMIAGLALALGFFVSVYVYRGLQPGNRSAGESGTDVVMAAADLEVGAKIGQHDVRLAKLPQSEVPPNSYTKLSQVLGRGIIIPISKGEFILPTKLAPENAGAGLPSLIPPGMRAVSVRVNEVVSVAGFVTPGTRVDVLLTGTPTGGSEPQTTTVLQNITVIAAGHTLERTASGAAQNTAVITLLVTPEDAQKLTLASSEGHIQLALRNPLDTRQDEVASSGSRGLYRLGSAPAPPTAVAHQRQVKREIKPLPQTPTLLSVEVYQGDKKPDVVQFPEGTAETK
jgi:pilus assembly protein CpaB